MHDDLTFFTMPFPHTYIYQCTYVCITHGYLTDDDVPGAAVHGPVGMVSTAVIGENSLFCDALNLFRRVGCK